MTLAACRGSDGQGGAPPMIAHEAHVKPAGIAPAVGRLENPLSSDSATVAEGGRIFRAMNCEGCHGDGALGFQGPSLVDGRWRHGGSDGEVFESIYSGRPRGMPAYGGMMSADMIWKVVVWIRAQPVPANVPTQSWVESR